MTETGADYEYDSIVSAALRRMIGQEASWAYFQRDNGPMFVWTTEPYHLRYGGPAEGKYESRVYVPYGPGSRSGKGRQWKVADGSESLHALRKDAKARALRLYKAYQAGNTTPWS